MAVTTTDVLVVGAGPSGLALALQAAQLGARVRIVERRHDAFRPSRAFIVHPRTLELLRPLGVADSVLAAGRRAPEVRLRLGHRTLTTTLGPFALSDTAYPFLALVPQAMVEHELAVGLAERGVEVERGFELVELEHRPAGTCAVVIGPGGATHTIDARFLAGCDGAGSTVRAATGIRWPGTGYRHEIVLADVELDGDLDQTAAHASAGPDGLVFLLAMWEQATWRLLATRSRDPMVGSSQPIEGAVIESIIEESGLDASVTAVAWSAAIPLQHRLAARYRVGPVFLVGDAAHTHSPAGGQGMNTGIQDGLNLGWKLAFAARMPPLRASTGVLLDSYEDERRAVARRMLAGTRLLFWLEAGTDPVARFIRSSVGPLAAPLAPLLLRQDRLIAQGVRSLSQLRVSYRTGLARLRPIDRSELQSLRPGDRLPDLTLPRDGGRTMHEVTQAPGVHLLLARRAPLPDDPRPSRWVHVRRIRSWPGEGTIGVRPDGHVGFAGDRATASATTAWLNSMGLGLNSRDRHR